jgi:hypothetical protein
MFKNNGTNTQMDTLADIHARMAAYDQLPAEIRARLQATGDDLRSLDLARDTGMRELLAVNTSEIREAA